MCLEEVVRLGDEVCDGCSSNRIIDFGDNHAELVCADCGLVYEEILHSGPEYTIHEFSDTLIRSRGGPPSNPRNLDKTTTFNPPEGRDRKKFLRLKKWQYRLRNPDNRSKSYVHILLQHFGSELNLHRSVIDGAAYLYNKVSEDNSFNSRDMNSKTVSCLYTACRIREIPKTLDEMIWSLGIRREDKRAIRKTFTYLRKSLKEIGIILPLQKPDLFINRFSSELNLSNKVRETALGLVDKVRHEHRASTVASGAIYIASAVHNERVLQRDIARKVGLSEVAVRQSYKKIVGKYDINILI